MADNNEKFRVLVIEDSPTQAHQVRFILSGAGFEVEVAGDGQTGIEKFDQSVFDIVLSDVVMPGMSGFEVCQKLKAHPRGKNTPVVLLTVLSELKDLIEGLRNGADNFLTKPYDPAFLVQRIRNVLDTSQKGGPAQSVCDPDSGVCFIDKSFLMSLDRKRMLDYLVSTFDDFLRMRQREADNRMGEASQRMEMLQSRERFLRNLVSSIDSPLKQADQTLASLIDGRFGELSEKQTKVLSDLKESLGRNQRSLHELIDRYGSDGDGEGRRQESTPGAERR